MNFKVSDVFDKNNEYHLWVLSFSMALQDLTKINNMLFNINVDDEKLTSLFLFKTNIGFLYEAVDLIDAAMTLNDISQHLKNIKGFKEKYDAFKKYINDHPEYPSLKNALVISRNKIFHYCKTRGELRAFKNILEEFEKDNFKSKAVFIPEPLGNDYVFAEELQLNYLEIIGINSLNLDFKNLLTKYAELTAQVINLLEIVVENFLYSLQQHKRTLYKYK